MGVLRPLLCTAGVLSALELAAAGQDLHAQTYYMGAEGGWTSLSSTNDTLVGVPNHRTYNGGFTLGVRGGIEWGPWRLEEEYTYRQSSNDTAQLAALLAPGGSVTGQRTSNAIMTNLLYDVPLGLPVTPHIGAGVGAVEITDNLTFPVVGQIGNSSDWELGYQAIAGIRYDIGAGLALDLDYRYFATTNATFHTTPLAGNIKYSSGYSTNNVMASLVYRFGAPTPPTPPASPAPLPPPSPKVFLIFFDWDKETVTPEGIRIVRQAADVYKAGGRVHLQVTGYTDRSGSPGYNQRLSERRANNVARALTGFGVAPADMTVSGRGENDNRVPTAPGVREPQNRRVEITS
jgi:OOP family OmpA-OmpF porin